MAFDKPLYLRSFQPTRRARLGVALGSGFVVAIVIVNYLVFIRGSSVAEPSLDQRLSRPVAIPQSPDPVQAEATAAAAAAPAESETIHIVEGALVRGETPTRALARLGAASASISDVLSALSGHVDMRALRAGQKMVLGLLPDGRIRSLTFPLNETAFVEVTSTSDGYAAEKRETPTQKEMIRFACSIKGSLYESLQRCGEDASLAPVLTEALSGQVDFFTDSRRGDVLRVSIEKESLGGRFLRYGDVHGIVYDGKAVTASVFPLEDQGQTVYYTADGEAAERPFMRSPVRYTRLSSDYSLKRLHPILRTYRPHRAQDYAAPKGTPVYAAGDGKVIFAAAKGAIGNLVVLQHANGWQTYYGHLSHFAKGLKAGDNVAKRTLVGYVGSTGRSTGPHLHYAVAKGGEFVHPRKLLTVPGVRIPASREAEFKANVGRAMGDLKGLPVRGIEGATS